MLCGNWRCGFQWLCAVLPDQQQGLHPELPDALPHIRSPDNGLIEVCAGGECKGLQVFEDFHGFLIAGAVRYSI